MCCIFVIRVIIISDLYYLGSRMKNFFLFSFIVISPFSGCTDTGFKGVCDDIELIFKHTQKDAWLPNAATFCSE